VSLINFFGPIGQDDEGTQWMEETKDEAGRIREAIWEDNAAAAAAAAKNTSLPSNLRLRRKRRAQRPEKDGDGISDEKGNNANYLLQKSFLKDYS